MKLLSMSGYIPEQICDTVRFVNYSGDRNISHYCGYISDYISMFKSDSSFDGAVFPHTCDSSRIIKSYLPHDGRFVHQLKVPIRSDSSAISFFAEMIREYKQAVEKHFGIQITDIAQRTEFVNNRNASIGKLYSELDTISYYDYISLIHRELALPLAEQNISASSIVGKNSGKKRVFLIGSFLCNVEIARKIEEYGFAVVGDNLPESRRLAMRCPVDSSSDIFEGIAGSIIEGTLSPTQNNFNQLMSNDLQEIKVKNVDAVIFILQKYCEPYEYLYSVYRKMLDENNIPSIKLSMTNSTDIRKADLLLESFADIL